MNSAGETESSKLVVEDLVSLERCAGIVRDVYDRLLAVKARRPACNEIDRCSQTDMIQYRYYLYRYFYTDTIK